MNILPSTPEDRRRMSIQAQARMKKDTAGHVVDKSLIMELADGRTLCPDCYDRWFMKVFG